LAIGSNSVLIYFLLYLSPRSIPVTIASPLGSKTAIHCGAA
jgi:hypothetical protein